MIHRPKSLSNAPWRAGPKGVPQGTAPSPSRVRLGLSSALLGLALCLLGCSEKERAEVARGGAEQGAPSQEWLEPEHSSAKHLVLIAVDGLRLGSWPGDRFPNLATLVDQGRAFPNHVVDSMGSQAQLASLLSGLPAAEHGVGSMHERGRTFLAPEISWWPEALQTQGWRTAASVATPQMGSRVGGMQRGFDEFVEPPLLPGSFRPGERVDLVMQAVWGEFLSVGEPFFVFHHLADFANPGKVPSAAVMRSAQQTLQSWVTRIPALAQPANEVGKGPEEFEKVRRGLGRSRGSEVLQAFHEAVYLGQLVDLDAAVGRLVADLKAAGRLEDTVIALCSLRGSMIGSLPAEGPAFPPEVARCPVVLWAPGRVIPGLDSSLLPTHEVGRRLAYLMGLEVGELPTDRAAATVWNASYSRRASIGKDLHVEENSAAGWVGFNRLGVPVMNPQALPLAQQKQWESVRAHADESPQAWGYRLDFDVPPGETWTLHWRMLRGRVRDHQAEPAESVEWVRKRRTSGTAKVTGKGQLMLTTFQREEPIRIAWEGVGQEPVTDGQPRLWMVRPSKEVHLADTLENGELQAQAEVMRDSGLWTRLLVSGEPGRPVEALAALVPQSQDAGRDTPELEITTDAAHRVDAIAGRSDGLQLIAPTPINTQFKELPPFELALAVRVAESWLRPHELGLEKGPWSVPGSAALFVPDWWPGMTESLGGHMDGAGKEHSGWQLLPGLQLRRLGSAPGGHRALDSEAAEYVRHMGKGE